jgi:hypothetical protein
VAMVEDELGFKKYPLIQCLPFDLVMGDRNKKK